MYLMLNDGKKARLILRLLVDKKICYVESEPLADPSGRGEPQSKPFI
jgi:hypothetical protein